MATTPVLTNPVAPEKLITGEEFAAMGEDATMGLELIAGRIVGRNMPTGDEHGSVELKLGSKLLFHVEITKSGKVRSGEVGIYLKRNPDLVRAADILYISNERYGKNTAGSYLTAIPDLTVEVMSPSDTWSELLDKLEEYFEAGVRLCWVVHPRTKKIYVYRSATDVRVLTERDELTGGDVLPGFSVKIADLFE